MRYQSLLQNKLLLSSQLRQIKDSKEAKTLSFKILLSHFSTETLATEQPHFKEEPWRYVTGLTKSDVDSNPVIAQFMEANYSDVDLGRGGKSVVIKTETEIEIAEQKAAKLKYQKELHPHAHLGIRSLHCYDRSLHTEEGSRVCRRFRRQKLIPGLIYGQESASKESARVRVGVVTPWNLLQRELDLYKYWVPSHVYELTLMSRDTNDIISKELVVPTDMQVHPIKNALNSINYIRYYPGRPVSIPVKYVNREESPMLRQGALLLPLKRSVPLIFEDGATFPEWLEVDVSGIGKMGGIGINKVIMPEGATFSKKVKTNLILGTVWGGKKAMDDDDDEEKEGEVKK